MDARVDPAHFLQLPPGEAFVLRNVGGRVTDDVVRALAMLWGMSSVATEGNPKLSLIVIQHLDCGLQKLADPRFRIAISRSSGITSDALDRMAIREHEVAIEADLAQLRDSELVPDQIEVSAHVYDPNTGRLREIVPRRTLGSDEDLVARGSVT